MRTKRAYVLIAVCVILGAYLADRERDGRAAPRQNAGIFHLKSRDVAVFGKVECIANIEAGTRNLLCQRRPRRSARYEAAVYPNSIFIYKIGNPDDPVYSTP